MAANGVITRDNNQTLIINTLCHLIHRSHQISIGNATSENWNRDKNCPPPQKKLGVMVLLGKPLKKRWDFFQTRGGVWAKKRVFFGAFCAFLPFFAANLPEISHTLGEGGGGVWEVWKKSNLFWRLPSQVVTPSLFFFLGGGGNLVH